MKKNIILIIMLLLSYLARCQYKTTFSGNTIESLAGLGITLTQKSIKQIGL